MLKKLSNVLPKKYKQFSINFLENIHSILLINFKLIRKLKIIKELKLLNKKSNQIKFKTNTSLVIIALKDADDRFKLLDEEIRNSTKIIHISRSLFRGVFAYLIVKKGGYKTDLSLGELPIEHYYDPKLKKYRKLYTLYCQKIAEEIKSLTKADCFLLPKLNDDWIIDLIKGIRLSNTKIIVHDREYGISEQRMKMYPFYLKKIYSDLKVDLLCLTNLRHYKFFELCGFSKKVLRITGNPITDKWFDLNNLISRKDISPLLSEKKYLIVFFAFGKNNYLNFFYKGEKRNWSSLGDDYHEILFDLLKEYSDKLQIIYKLGGKAARDTYEKFNDFILRLEKNNLQDSLLVLDGRISTQDLLKVSDCVIGFQTLGLIEAMFTKQPIFHGGWGELYNDVKETLMPLHHSKGLNFYQSKDEMYNAISEYIKNPSLHNQSDNTELARKISIEEMYYIADGRSSRRLLETIEEFLQKSI